MGKSNSTSARRYARAVFDLAVQQHQEDRWKAELERVSSTLSDTLLRSALENPRIPFASKQDMLKAVLEGVDPLALNLAYLLARKRQTELVEDITAQYSAMLDSHRGVEHAKVTTAVSLEDQELQAIAGKLSRMTGKKIVAHPEVDPGILGGMIVRIGDQLIDGSVRGKLERLKRDLARSSAAAGTR